MAKNILLALAMFAVLALGTSHAGPVNFGFEDQGTTGWFTSDFGVNVASSLPSPYSVTPKKGSYFLTMQTSEITQSVFASQDFEAVRGDVLTGYAALVESSAMSMASVKLYRNGPSNPEWLWTSDPLPSPNWETWSYPVQETGSYFIEYTLEVILPPDDPEDPQPPVSGYALAVFDGHYQPVPLPAAAWLLGPGLAGIAVMRRRFKK